MNTQYTGYLKYRAKSIETGKWCLGTYNHLNDTIATIFGNYELINRETLSMWTGLTDKNGVKIFGGDIIRHNYKFGNGLGIVEFSPKWGFILTKEDGFTTEIDLEEGIIIGNIWDNPVLLEGAADV